MSLSLIIVILLLAIVFLVYKYQKIGNTKVQVLTPRKVPKEQQQSYIESRDVMPHMTYSTGPFDDYMWRYPEVGGKTIVSQQNSPYGQGLLPRPMPPNSTYIGQYPYYIRTFNGPF